MVDIRKTLVIRFSSIGDIVLSSPLLRVLRARFPDSQIDFLTKKDFAELVRSNQNINVTHEFDASEGFDGLRRMKRRLRDEAYDLIVDIHNSLRSRYVRAIRDVPHIVTIDKRIKERTALVRFKKNLYGGIVPVSDRYIEPVEPFGVRNDGKGLELHIPDAVQFGVNARIAPLRLSRFERVIGFCPGAKHFTKRWPAARFSELGAALVQKHGAGIMLFGGPDEIAGNAAIGDGIRNAVGKDVVIDLTGTLSLLESAAAMEYVDVVVTNDTGLMHLAAAKDKPLVALFGSTVREFGFFPESSAAIVLETEGLKCRPCSHVGRDMCPEGHFRCMQDIAVGRVEASVDTLLRSLMR